MMKILAFLFILLKIATTTSFENQIRRNGDLFTLDYDVTKLMENKKFVSKDCRQQLFESVENGAWIKMLDSSSKSLDGFLVLNIYNLGMFDECYDLETPVKNSKEVIHGKYCLGTIPVSVIASLMQNGTSGDEPDKLTTDTAEFGFHIAVCVPSACTADDVNKFTANLIHFTDGFCYSQDTEPELDWGAILTIVVLGVFLVIVIMSTIFDIVLYYKQAKTPHPLLIAFSAFSNGQKLIAVTNNPNQLLCLNGLKAMSMMWVILGHEFAISFRGALTNILDFADWQYNVSSMYIIGATVSVDTFFLVGGLVMVYTFLKAVDNGVKFNVPMFYLHRLIRLLPALIVVLVFHITLLNYVGSGPLWHDMDNALVKACRSSWWRTLLFIQNYDYTDDSICVPQSWYLAVDMQLFVLSPLILLPLARWPKKTLIVMYFLVVLSLIIDFAIAYAYKLIPIFIQEGVENSLMTYYYLPTHTRYGPYVIGMIFGYYIYKNKTGQHKLKLTMTQALILWVILLLGLAACIYGGTGNSVDSSRWSNSLYITFNRPAWTIAVGGVSYLCIAGYGGPIDLFLSHPIFQFLQKLSYSSYLIHFAVVSLRYYTMKTAFKFTDSNMISNFWGDFALIVVLSVALCLTFESPLIIIERYLFGAKPKKQQTVVEAKKPTI